MLYRRVHMIYQVQTVVFNFFKIHFNNIIPSTPTAYHSAFAHSNTGIVNSNPTQRMDVCVRLFCACVVLCVGSGFATG
jgi:hypothetical protein